MYNVYKPFHISEEFTSSILLKICPDWKYLMDFVEGKFFMNTNMYFSSIEKKGILTNAQFDKLEGTQTLLKSTEDVELVIDFTEEQPRILQGKRGEFKYKGTPIINAELGRNRPHNIYCLYSIWYGRKNGVVTQVDSRIRAELGEYFAIVLNKEEFLNRVERAAKKLPYKLKSNIQYGFVNYVKTENQPYVDLGVFKKNEKYIYQNEFRIVLELDREPEPLQYFEVGDLSDIVLVGKTENLLGIEYKDNCIKIGKSKLPIKWSE